MQLKWTDFDEADLDHIEKYISEKNSSLVAVDVILNMLDTVELILPAHPEAGRLGRKKGTRELVIDGIPFIVVYRQVEQQLHILRVLHDAQKWVADKE